jgi:hypothetical protein
VLGINQPFLLLLSCLLCTSRASAPPTPISHVQVTLKGKRYDIQDVTTVGELQERIQEASGIAPSQQGRILFQGKSLSKSIGTESLSEAGVSEGDLLNCVPITSSGTKKKKPSSVTTGNSPTVAESSSTTTTSTSTPQASLKEMMQSSGVDTKAMEDMVSKMMGSGGAGDGGMPNLQESMELMSNMMKSPIFTDYMSDPEKLEQSRQMILNNPMLKSMMGSMPGMEELLNDPEAWAGAMKAAADMYSQMDQNDLMSAMMQGAEASMAANGNGMPGGGLFDGIKNGVAGAAPTTPTALDELSEGDE